MDYKGHLIEIIDNCEEKLSEIEAAAENLLIDFDEDELTSKTPHDESIINEPTFIDEDIIEDNSVETTEKLQ